MTCKACGREFEARRSTARFCSTRCRVANHRSVTAVTVTGLTSGGVTLKGRHTILTDADVRPGRLEDAYIAPDFDWGA